MLGNHFELQFRGVLFFVNMKSTQHSDKGDATHLRKSRERKLHKLVDKCRVKNIRFAQYYVHISKKMARDPALCSDVELVELTTEC